jgi:arsenical pump membrane protein
VALIANPAAWGDAVDQSWRAFVLVTGLLLVGVVAADDGLFGWLAAKLDAIPGGGQRLFFAGLLLVAVTTAFLNLDTAVVFLTPVMVAAARRRGVDELPFLYGTVFMVNAASLFLPGSNLTNLIVIGHENVSGAEFAQRMFPAGLGAVLATALAVWLLHRKTLGGGQLHATSAPAPGALGLIATLGVVVLLLVARNPAPAVLAVGIIAVTLLWRRGRLSRDDLAHAVSPLMLGAIFCVTVALGTLARVWGAPAELMDEAARVPTAIIGAVAAVLVNNLPAAAMLSAGTLHHGRALLIGLNVGPNLAVTGSLSAFLWLQTARSAGAQPSIRHYSRLGALVAPAGIAGALVAIYVLAPSRV